MIVTKTDNESEATSTSMRRRPRSRQSKEYSRTNNVKDIIRITIIGGTLLALALLAAPQRASAGDKGYGELKKDLQTAKDDLSKAEAKAQENKPDDATKVEEDKLDKLARKNDDTQKNDKGKAAAQKAEDDARDANPVAKGSKAEAYRKALADRREARKKLIKVIADLQDLKRRQQSLSDKDDVDTPIKEAREAQRKSESTISLGRTATGIGETCAVLISTGKIKVETSGTGETIGHIADLTIQNLTDQLIMCAIPPMILESGSGKNQHYACPKGQTVALNPRQEKTVPMDGVCVNRSKPPVGKGVTGDLVINEGNPTLPQNPNSHVPPKDANKLLRLCTSKYDAADKLQKDGALKDLPYKDKQKQKDIVTQWSTWCDPRISELTGAPPATKEDLKKVVYKQVPEPMTPETKKKIDKGIDTIFEKVELTTAKAKDLEKADEYAQVETTGAPGQGNTSEISDNRGESTETPPPQTQEKPKKKKQKEKDLKLSAPVTDWVKKLVAAFRADDTKQRAQDDYKRQLNNFFKKNKQHGELEEKVKKIQGTLSNPLNNNSAAENDKLIKERDDLTKELTKFEGELEKYFQQTDEGKKALVAKGDAEKAANDAHKAEEEAGKYLNKEELTKEALEQLLKEALDKARREP